MVEILNTFANVEAGIESYVTYHDRGFAVSLKDVDSGEFMDIVNIYPKIEDAVAYAKKIVK